MITTTTILATVIPALVSLVAGYLARHNNVPLPGLPAPTPAPAPHVSLLQQILGIAKPEAEKLLAEAVKDVIQKGLADLKASQAKQ